MLPNILNAAIEATVSLKRISSFLQAEEIDGDMVKPSPSHSDVAIDVVGSKFYWDDSRKKVALQDLGFKVQRGEMCIVTGKVGSGKTALLKLLINDLVRDDQVGGSHVFVNGSIAYASQVPWI